MGDRQAGARQSQDAQTAVTVGDVMAVLDDAYPPSLAQGWDSVGLVCGDPAEPVSRVLVAVDVTDDVVAAAVDGGYDFLLAHHPLLMRGVDTVAASTPKGRAIHRLVRGRVALFTAHTNADSARPGVSDALADALGVLDTRPLAPQPLQAMDKWVVMVPEGNAEQVSEAMFAAGAGAIGEYRDCAWSVIGTGQFEALEAADPTIGLIGERTRVDEARIEMVARRGLRSAVLTALRGAHPYEEPAFDVFELADIDSSVGIGRVGRLAEPVTFGEFVRQAGEVLGGPWGVRGAGDPTAMVSTVAVCGGSGDSYLDAAAAAGVDAYVTGDLRHHPADESGRAGGPLLVDAGHWGTEFPWCAQAAALLTERLGLRADVHQASTDPFVLHAGAYGVENTVTGTGAG